MKPSERRKQAEAVRERWDAMTQEERATENAERQRFLTPVSAADRQQMRRERLRQANVKQISINLPDAAYQELKRLCTETGRSYSDVLGGMLLGGWGGRPILPLQPSWLSLNHRLERIPVNLIDPRGYGTEDEEFMDELADSIHDIGLVNPITVKEHTVVCGGKEEARYEVVSGFKRLAAVRRNDHCEISAFVIRENPKKERLIAIADNLHRRELTVEERAKLNAEWHDLAGEG